MAWWTILISGCQSDDSAGVSAVGSVTVAGQPLSGAVITLEPSRGTTGPNASAPIFGGQFDIGSDAGLDGGTYRVRVAMIPAEILAKLPEEVRVDLPDRDVVVDPKFDADSQISCELLAGEPNQLAFEIDFLPQ